MDYRFKVEKQDVFLGDGRKVQEKQAVVRQDTNQVIGVVGRGYHPIDHYKILDAFDATGILELQNVNLCKDGAVMFANYKLKDKSGFIRKEEVKVGDIVDFGVRAFNAHNGDSGVGFEVYGLRLACLNGMKIPRTLSRISVRHTSSAVIGKIREAILYKEKQIRPTVEVWQNWMNVRPSKARIEQFFAEAGIGERLSKDLLPRSLNAVEKDGVWGVWNEFTHYVTHELAVKNESNRILSVINKEQQYLSRFYTFNWNEEPQAIS